MFHIDFVFNNLIVTFREPLIKFDPSRWNFLRRYKSSCKYLRSKCREQILKRIEVFNKNPNFQCENPTDLFTYILASHSK
jgi:hypothetical protein